MLLFGSVVVVLVATRVALVCSHLVGELRAQRYEQPRYFITAPNAFRVGVPERVSASVSGPVNATIKLFLQDYPHRQRTFSEVLLENVGEGNSAQAEMLVNRQDLPIGADTSSTYVFLVALSETTDFPFQQEVLVLVSFDSGYVFVHTDKPVYTPRETVLIRLISLDEALKPRKDVVRCDVLNPQGIIVYRSEELTSDSGFAMEKFSFPAFPKFGNWSAIVHYGPQLEQNSTVKFEVREYVLPTFSVKVDPPRYILPQDPSIKGSVTAKYVYGKPVIGYATLRFAVKVLDEKEPIFFATQLGRQLTTSGVYSFEVPMSELRSHSALRSSWFPRGARLVVDAEVTESVGGVSERAVVSTARFSEKPHSIRVGRSVLHFKPGLPYVLKLETEAAGLSLDQQTKKDVNVLPQQSSSGKFLVLLPTQDPVIVGETAEVDVRYSHAGDDHIRLHYIVLSRGRIVHESTPQDAEDGDGGRLDRLAFEVTPALRPNCRVIAWYIHQSAGAVEVVADSITIGVAPFCPLSLSLPKSNYLPNERADLTIRAEAGATVGLTAIDEAVYFLTSNKQRLTSARVDAMLAKHDLGCGPGGGLNSQLIFKEAGLTVISNTNLQGIQRIGSNCPTLNRRRKRSIRTRRSTREPSWSKQCCTEGEKRDTYVWMARTCEQRAESFRKTLATVEARVADQCASFFVFCCRNFAKKDPAVGPKTAAVVHTPDRSQAPPTRGRMGRKGVDLDEPQVVFRSSSLNNDDLDGITGMDELDEEEDEEEVDEETLAASIIRTFFPETWIFEDFKIG